MSEVDNLAKDAGIRFRHFYDDVSNKHIATIATRISDIGNFSKNDCIIDIGASFCSVLDEADKEKAKHIAMGRVLRGSKKFMLSVHIDVLRQRIKDKSILDMFVDNMHPTFKDYYVVNGLVTIKGRFDNVPRLNYPRDFYETEY